ncbi:ABC transporter G family member 26 [Physcomitrium patens]|uniref:ABC transporter domain-containing protein n=1 Tax=Physcomitrium patens TaxID=3218 RepID=A0A2K1JWA7_PHYPA|nr:ABC transporter G family member 26-like [Physcomitrium patens]PNR45813.1 hypothetical protein PHYPA_015584 [Physcomitrium patens]|eukprot:XP_024388362.1 ABC transporter G family member 26-like [Physcomitrella patens]
MKRPGLEMEDVKIMGRRSKASARFSGSDPMRGEASRHVENLDTGGVGDEVQIQSDAGRDADHQVFGYLSNSRTSVHIPESGMIPQLRFNPEIEDMNEHHHHHHQQQQYYGDSPNTSNSDLTDNEQFRINPVEGGFIGRSGAGPPLPIILKFEDVSYKVELKPVKQAWATRLKSFAKVRHSPSTEKKILNDITASVAPGEMLALMGASGSGKTTLLNILGGRLAHQKNVTGQVTYNGRPYSTALKRRMGFVTQDDVLFPTLTVRETLVFAALLRLPSCMSQLQKIQRADTVLIDLGLERCKNTSIGGPFIRGVSGGERKRTSIGYEILVEPSLLFLDEPTSGLDSATALKILNVLQKNALAGRVIVTTIHQPSSRMFHMFDKLVLLSEGYPLYSGYASEAMQYFGSLSIAPQIAMNPAEFLLDLATGVTNDITVPEDLESGINLRITRHMSQLRNDDADSQREFVLDYLRKSYKSLVEPLEKQSLHQMATISKDLGRATRAKKRWTSSWGSQFLILFKRTWTERRKDYFSALKFVQAIGVSALLGLLWWQGKLETNANIQDQQGLLFYINIFWTTFSMWTTLMTFPMERQYLAKERAADMYRLSAYYLSSTICDGLAELIYPTLFIGILYFMAGLRKSLEAFLYTLLATFLIGITAQGFGEMFGAATLSLKSAGVIASIFLLIFLLAGGYYVRKMPPFMRWIKYLSFVYYGYRLLQKVQYTPDQTYSCATGCEPISTSPALHELKLNSGVQEAWVLVLMAIVYRLVSYFSLHRV